MYLSCLLVEDGIRHLFSINQSSVSSLFFLLFCVRFSLLVDSALALVDLLSASCLVSYHTNPVFSQSYLGRQFYLAAATLATTCWVLEHIVVSLRSSVVKYLGDGE